MREMEKGNGQLPAASLTSSGDDDHQIAPGLPIVPHPAVTSEESQSESGQSPSDEGDTTMPHLTLAHITARERRLTTTTRFLGQQRKCSQK